MAASSAFHQVNSVIGKDPAVSQITVTLDPKAWSKRKQNIIIESLLTGVAACGASTSWLVKQLSRAAGSDTISVTKWNNAVEAHRVKPEKLEELVAYTCAWIKLRPESDNQPYRVGQPYDHYYQYHAQKIFLNRVEQGFPVKSIPLPPNLPNDEKREFIAEYLREETEQDIAARQRLADMIRNGEPITITFT